MSLDEARSSISEIIAAATDFKSSMQSLQNDLSSFANDVSNVTNSIVSNIRENNIIGNSEIATTKIVGFVDDTINLGNEALAALSEDANKKIKEIVDNYNNYNDSLPIEKKEDRRGYVELSL